MKRITFFISTLLYSVICFAAEPNFSDWALPIISVAHVRATPAHAAEMVSQVLMGMPLKVCASEKSGWCYVETPEGYNGYVNKNSLQMLDSTAIERWKHADRLIITSPNEVKAYSDTLKAKVVTDLVPGNIIECNATYGDWIQVFTPDRRKCWINRTNATSLKQWASQKSDARTVIAHAENQIGAPYLWGGMTVKGMDCSGLSKMSYYQNGIILRRDASQQAVCGKRVDRPADFQPGDLLFFGNKSTGKVDHVGIFIEGDLFIESSGRVKISKVSQQKRLLHAVRVIGCESTPGITRAINHPWYF
ncbi:MAG: C40 family peptidase [Muribaculum sp.]|nr:C40 family peptidase [Muribaculaceae bacterium]MCM1080657.1 C40 family peptidase [Muribaculum sp.]